MTHKSIFRVIVLIGTCRGWSALFTS